ncbi:helix-turn-helix domain-containing protein, partial [bacterium]|nr:helix-turn-helix domain-containing protein [bacterium]
LKLMKMMSRRIMKNICYKNDMAAGRPSNLERTEFGNRLYKARIKAGFTQKETSERLEVSQQSVAFWERKGKSLLADMLCKVASLFNVTTDELLGLTSPKKLPVPVGKLRKSFDQASKLSRRQQEKIAEVVDALVASQSAT